MGMLVQRWHIPHWTLEYCLFKSSSLGIKFEEIVKEVHPKGNFSDFNKELCRKLISKRLKKLEIATRLAQALEEETEIIVDKEDETDTIKYLIDAIKHAAGRN